MSKICKKFARNLKEARLNLGWTQAQAAEKLGFSLRHYQTLESKKCPNISLEKLEKIARKFKEKPETLIS